MLYVIFAICDYCAVCVTLQKPVIPATVTDQIRLWELERDRFRFADGVLYSQFLCQKDFDLLRDHARVSIFKLLLCSTSPQMSYAHVPLLPVECTLCLEKVITVKCSAGGKP